MRWLRGSAARAVAPHVAGWVAIIAAAVALAGWTLHLSALTTLALGSAPLKPGSAAAFLFVGVALASTGPMLRRTAGVAVVVLAGTALASRLVGGNAGFEWMGPDTAVGFLGLGSALVLLPSVAARRRRAAEIISAAVALLALFEIEALAVGGGAVASPRSSAPAAALFAALALGAIAAVPDGWLLAHFEDPRPPGILLRRLLPSAIGLPLVLEWLSEVAHQTGMLDAQNQIPFILPITILLLLGTGVWGVVVADRAETARRSAEERFRAFFDESPIGKSVTAPNGRLLRVNPAFCTMLGYSPQELQNLSWSAITHADDLARSTEGQRALLAREADTWDMEKRYRAKDGRWVWTHVTIGVHRDAAGSPEYFLTHVQDITDRRRAELALERSEQYHRTLIEQSLDIITILDADAVMRYLSPSVERVLGFPVTELTGRRAFDYIHPDDLEIVLHAFTEGVASPGATRTLEYRFRHRDGSWRFLEGVGRNLLDNPLINAVVVNARDVTERKDTEASQHALLHQLQAALAEVKTLRGFLRICAGCKRVATDDGGWEQFESYIRAHSGVEFSHGICPDCAAKWASDVS